MHFSLFLFASFNILLIFGYPPGYNETQKRLTNLSKQLSRVESLLNSSVNRLLRKIDDSNKDTKSLIESLSIQNKNGMSQSSGRSVNALLIIDVQNDFIDGSLALRNCQSKHNGEEVVPVINQLLNSKKFDVVVYSYDWHPTDHISFLDNVHLRSHLLTNDSVPLAQLQLYSTATFAINGLARMEQTLWPRHCVQNTSGAEMHKDLQMISKVNADNISVIDIYKGPKSDIDSYSAFWDNSKLSETTLNKQLKEKGVTQVFVTGLATDVCVYSTAIHAIEYGYKTFIVEDACRGVDENAIKKRLDDIKQKKGHIIQSNQVKDYVK